MRVLVLEGAKSAALAIVRSLGKKDIDVTVGERIKFCTAGISKYCRSRIKYPAPEIDRDFFLQSILTEVKRGKYDVVYPVAGETTLPISEHKHEFLPYTKIPIPDYETVRKADDKAQTLQIARQVGIPCPKTYFPKDQEEVDKIGKEMEFPVVIKPRRKLRWIKGGLIRTKVTRQNYVFSSTELKIKYEKISEKSPLPFIQEYVPGDSYGFFALLNHSEPRAIFAHRRLREYPVTGGASTLRESVYDEEIKELGLRLLKAMNWHGVAMVEFRSDNRDNKFKLIEVNGRWWGSLPLAIASGVDFPYLLHKMVTEGDVEPVTKYKIGIKCRLLIPNDLLWLVSSLRHSPKKMEALLEFFKFRNMYYDIISKDDPFPILGALRAAFESFEQVLTGRATISGELIKK
ncbi:carboxylate--amine ligase [bacterium]|nr:carboxylate--amine ligase [bacterium]NIN92560.1 carboxylate--amine ligase [bacterium]NIO18602.1 carboxylate--amine ligase [bacterium]NIO73617.1 carboxylate--amine ligase [bacterium]